MRISDWSSDVCSSDLIMDLWVREARLFKYGSGTGTNFSSLRGEEEGLSGGGKSSGLMSFLKIGDRAAGAIKSGRSEERRVGQECVSTCRSRWSTYHSKKNTQKESSTKDNQTLK